MANCSGLTFLLRQACLSADRASEGHGEHMLASLEKIFETMSNWFTPEEIGLAPVFA
jgi:hypothetical protein